MISVTSAHRDVRKLVESVRRRLEKHGVVTLSALERAIVLALDTARVAVAQQLAELEGLQTSYVEVTDKATGAPALRCKVNLVLRRSAEMTGALEQAQADEDQKRILLQRQALLDGN